MALRFDIIDQDTDQTVASRNTYWGAERAAADMNDCESVGRDRYYVSRAIWDPPLTMEDKRGGIPGCTFLRV